MESNKRSQDPAIQAKLKAAAELSAAAEVRKANPETANTDKKDSDFEARSQVWPLIQLKVKSIYLGHRVRRNLRDI